MPKIVDHDKRRSEIIGATMRAISRIGLSATTVREIANEAGYSSGVLAHYFTNKKEILMMAHVEAFNMVTERIERNTQGLPGLEALRVALLEALPLDEARRLEAHIDVSFWGHAILDPELRTIRTNSYTAARERWEGRISRLRKDGIVKCRESDRDVASEILIMIDGLSAQALIHPHLTTPEVQQRVVDSFLERIQRR